MKKLNIYLFEKLKIDKDITLNKRDKDDPKTWRVGDILTATFSYSMTLVKFYEIVRFTGKTFVLRKLKQKVVKGDGMEGECVPIEGQYDGTELYKARINKWNSVKVDDYYCSLWTGESVWFTHLD